MGMSDQEYARVVGELKGTQAHKEDWADQMMRTNAEDFTRYIGSFADYAASDIEYAHIKNPALAPCDPATARATRARGKEIRARADAMGGGSAPSRPRK